MTGYDHPISVAFEIKEMSDKGSFKGYGSVFSTADRGGDVVEPGAFGASLAEHSKAGTWPAMLYQHDPSREIGEWSEIREDAKGLWVEGKLWLDDVEDARRAHRSMLKARGRAGLSIGYHTKRAEWDRTAEVRRLHEVNLWEISLVTFPMNIDATVIDAKRFNPREAERALRDAGFSQKDAVKAVACFKSMLRDGAGDVPQGSRDEGPEANDIVAAIRHARGVFTD